MSLVESRRLPRGLGIAATAAAALALWGGGCGGDDGDASQPDGPARTATAEAGPTDADSATCAEIGGTKRYPQASLEQTLRASIVVAADYTEKFGQPQDVVARAFAAAVLPECHNADDPSYRPMPVLRKRADAAGAGNLLTGLLPEDGTATTAPTEPASAPHDPQLASKIDDACSDRAKLRPLIARAEKLDVARGKRLALDLARLDGTIQGVSGDAPADEELADTFREPISDLGRAIGSLSVQRQFDQAEGIAKYTKELRAARSASVKAANNFKGADALPACVKLLGG